MSGRSQSERLPVMWSRPRDVLGKAKPWKHTKTLQTALREVGRWVFPWCPALCRTFQPRSPAAGPAIFQETDSARHWNGGRPVVSPKSIPSQTHRSGGVRETFPNVSALLSRADFSSCTEAQGKKGKAMVLEETKRGKPKAAGPYSVPPQHRLPKQCKDSFLVEQVFSPHPYPASLKAHMKNDPLYADMRLTELAEVKRGPPSWTIEEYARNAGDKGKLTALDLQTQESLNPNNLEYWMEDVYTPGYDSLLKRKEAEFRRAKVCKIAALVAAAACTVILVVVVPICTMKS